ncbi:hypothetical protein C8Q76DRAFT_801942 [Earliella scabrosa]|nr:hypothetical protein C8Q76DRAFT_801942 [Earliella scabrosa]
MEEYGLYKEWQRTSNPETPDVAPAIRLRASWRARPRPGIGAGESTLHLTVFPPATSPPLAMLAPTRLCTRLPHVLDYTHLSDDAWPEWDAGKQEWSLPPGATRQWDRQWRMWCTYWPSTPPQKPRPRLSLTTDPNWPVGEVYDRVEEICVEVARPLFKSEGDVEPRGWESALVSTPVECPEDRLANRPQTPFPRDRAAAAAWTIAYPEGMCEEDLPEDLAVLAAALRDVMQYLAHTVDEFDEDMLEDDWVLVHEEGTQLMNMFGLRGPERLVILLDTLRNMLPRGIIQKWPDRYTAGAAEEREVWRCSVQRRTYEL